MGRKADTMSYKEFDKLSKHPEKNPIITQGVLFDDENINQLEETLIGMEYDIEDADELEDDEDENEKKDEKEDEDESALALADEASAEDLGDVDEDLLAQYHESIYDQKKH